MQNGCIRECYYQYNLNLSLPGIKREVDVLIIGGGIPGITAAKQLLDSGKTIALVGAHTIGGMTTGLSTGNLYVSVQAFYQSIELHFNLNTAI